MLKHGSKCSHRVHLLPVGPTLRQVLRMPQRDASSSHPTNPAVLAERGVLFTVLTGWGQAPGTVSEPVTVQRDSMVSLAKPRLYAHAWVPPGGAEGTAIPIWTDSWRGVSSKGILSAVTRKEVNEYHTGRHCNLNVHQNWYPLKKSIC